MQHLTMPSSAHLSTWELLVEHMRSLRNAQTQVIGFCPTGWMYEMKRSKIPVKTKGPNSIHLVPYSEHSSYNELREYVRFLKPHKVAARRLFPPPWHTPSHAQGFCWRLRPLEAC